jgi:hypothetical protein
VSLPANRKNTRWVLVLVKKGRRRRRRRRGKS